MPKCNGGCIFAPEHVSHVEFDSRRAVCADTFRVKRRLLDVLDGAKELPGREERGKRQRRIAKLRRSHVRDVERAREEHVGIVCAR